MSTIARPAPAGFDRARFLRLFAAVMLPMFLAAIDGFSADAVPVVHPAP